MYKMEKLERINLLNELGNIWANLKVSTGIVNNLIIQLKKEEQITNNKWTNKTH